MNALDATQLALIDALAGGDQVSGAQLAERLSLSREAISKRIARLAEFGLEIRSSAGHGYQLSQPLERLDAAALQAALSGHCAVSVLPTTASTNAWLRDQAGGTHLCLAEHQSAGRGRRGRRWHSPFGRNLYLSLRQELTHWPARLGALPLVIGVALAEYFDSLGVPLQLKWPNDLYLEGRKLGGLLIEQGGEAHGPCRLVVGLGINHSMAPDTRLDQPWISLTAAGHALSRNALAAGLAHCLLDTLAELDDAQIGARLERFARFDLFRDQAVHLHQEDGVREGVARGIDAAGRLQLETPHGVVAVSVGDVSLRAVP